MSTVHISRDERITYIGIYMMARGGPDTMRPGGDEGYRAIIDFRDIFPSYRSAS